MMIKRTIIFLLMMSPLWLFSQNCTSTCTESSMPVLKGLVNRKMDIDIKVYLINGNQYASSGQTIFRGNEYVNSNNIASEGIIVKLTPAN